MVDVGMQQTCTCGGGHRVQYIMGHERSSRTLGVGPNGPGFNAEFCAIERKKQRHQPAAASAPVQFQPRLSQTKPIAASSQRRGGGGSLPVFD